MKAIIAEKPSVAREIAQVLQVQTKKDGYFSGKDYCITWALGHLIELAMPEDYGITGFDRSVLPIFPSPFKLVPKTIKKAKGSMPDPAAFKQLQTIGEIFKQCDSIIVATDAGREGELIFRYIYDYLECRKPFERLWISSLTEKAISEGFNHLKPGTNFDALYSAAKSRNEADWVVGINASQALTIAGDGDTYSLGRVQTPSLAMICQRFIENQQFNKQKYYQIQLKHRKEYLDFSSLSTEHWHDKKQTEKILNAVGREGRAYVEEVQTKTIKEAAPPLFDLTALQKEANRKLGLTADEVLRTAQSLYEQKFITYPRTGSSYITEDLWQEIPDLVRVLKDHNQFKSAVNHLKFGNFNKRIVDDTKVTDHHGLLTTHKIPSALPAMEKAIYNMIAYRLLEALSEFCLKEVSHTFIKVLHYQFTISGVKILHKGWRSIRGILSENDSDDEHENLVELPILKNGDELKLAALEVREKMTQPPRLYTEADLLSAMENAGNLKTDKNQQQILQGTGIGTPATRASIIETLIARNYIVRKNKTLLPTEKGLRVYHFTKGRLIADIKMTTEWEMSLYQIEHRQLEADGFLSKIQNYTAEITQELLALSIPSENRPELQCPKCGKQQLIIRDKVVKCHDENCQWILFRNMFGVHLSTAQITSLITEKRTPMIKNLKAKNGKKFNAVIFLKDDHTTSFDFSAT